MRKNISFVVLSNTGSLLKQFSIPKSYIGVLFAVFLAIASGIGYIVYDYTKIRISLFEKAALENKISVQADEIETQLNQIQEFASKINHLNARVCELDDFENKIRDIANLEESENQDGVFGVGGPMPTNLNIEGDVKENKRETIRKMHKGAEQLLAATRIQRDDFESLMEALEKQVVILAATPAIRPVKGMLTSSFGFRISPFTGLRDFHEGMDIAAKTGTPVKASADGTITFAGDKGFLGNTVIIDHGRGIVTRYGHLSKIIKNRGDSVKRGEIVGEVGSTGRSTGSHLHYEVLVKGVPVNPQNYILN